MDLAVEGGWTTATLVMVPTIIALVLVCFVLGLLFVAGRPREWGGAWSFWAGGVVIALVGAWGMWPFSKAYHYWQPVSGVVEQVDRRLVNAGDGMAEKVVVRFEGDPQQYGVEDTRAALLKQGDQATLLCKRAHQFGPSVDGFDCRWGGG